MEKITVFFCSHPLAWVTVQYQTKGRKWKKKLSSFFRARRIFFAVPESF